MNTAIKQITGLCAPMMIDDIDTDIIIPAQYLTQTSKDGYGQYAFSRLKQADADFVLNQQKYQTAKILIAGDNFGCGSSREHAVWAIQELGFQAIIAPSFADIFSNNARKNGLVLIEQPLEICEQLAAAAQQNDLIINIDLVNAVFKTDQQTYPFAINPFFQHCITKGQDELDYLCSHLSQIKSHHQNAKGQTIFLDNTGVTQ